MKINLHPFQDIARQNLRKRLNRAARNYYEDREPQIVSFTANTGAGKTIILISLVESIYRGDENYPAQRNAIFVWLSDSPELNEQSKEKFAKYANEFIADKLVTIDDETFNRATLADGTIYFLNTQKLSRTSNLTKHGERRQYTIWETLQRTAEEKSDRLYLIIDEAHRGARNVRETLTIMQKFIKGSPDDGLKPLPVVLGMSATIDRFNELVKNSGATISYCAVPAEDVREAGLLKDRILVVYTKENERDMSMLQAATLNWLDKCKAWQPYNVKPIFIVQVQSGTGRKVSDTDLDECLKIISDAANKNFEVGEVVHTFGEATDLTINGLKVVYREPSKISDDERIKVVLFKENLSTGWDCPQAETMMSFRRAVDATYIAQLIGRMIRTPLHRRITDDETLNEVQLFLPQFDRDTVQDILNELNSSELGAVTKVDAQALGEKKFQTLTICPKNFLQPETSHAEEFSQPETSHAEEFLQPETSRAEDFPQAETSRAEDFPQAETSRVENFLLTPLEVRKRFLAINREEIFNFVNALGLTTYRINGRRSIDRLTAIFALARLLNQSGIYHDALDEVISAFVEMIRAYVDKLKTSGDYDAEVERIRNFKLNAEVIDLERNKTYGAAVNLFSAIESDTDRQFEAVKKKFRDDTIANEYRKKYNDPSNADIAKIDVILFANNPACMDAAYKFAEKKYREFDEKYRHEFARKNSLWQNKYDEISSSSAEISPHNFRLPERIMLTLDEDGKNYSDHLFVDENGTARIKLNGWEAGVLNEDRRRKDFVCWLRNVDRKDWALNLVRENDHGVKKNFFPDFLIFRRTTDGFVVDVLEPHLANDRDNLSKAQALAKYAKDNPIVGRVELIRQDRNVFRRLPMTRNEIREKVLRATSNAELDNIFSEHGQLAAP